MPRHNGFTRRPTKATRRRQRRKRDLLFARAADRPRRRRRPVAMAPESNWWGAGRRQW